LQLNGCEFSYTFAFSDATLILGFISLLVAEVFAIGELILPIAFAFTGRGDFVCPNTWNELFSSRQN
jgi:hypothetical protein